MIFKVYVHTYSDPKGSFATNAMEYQTREKAEEAADELASRWMAVESWEVREEESRK